MRFTSSYTTSATRIRFYNAIVRQDANEIRKLISAGANVNEVDCRKETPLFDVLWMMHCSRSSTEQWGLEMISYLCDHGADLNVRNWAGQTPISYAQTSGLTSVVNLLSQRILWWETLMIKEPEE